ncbi:MAG: hypothetical protein ACHBMF_08665 [Chromatiales bacterium]
MKRIALFLRSRYEFASDKPTGGETIEADRAVRFALAIEDGQTPPGSDAFLGHVPLAAVIEKFGAR